MGYLDSLKLVGAAVLILAVIWFIDDYQDGREAQKEVVVLKDAEIDENALSDQMTDTYEELRNNDVESMRIRKMLERQDAAMREMRRENPEGYTFRYGPIPRELLEADRKAREAAESD